MIDRLARGPGAVRALVAVLDPEDHAWRPGDADWSALEIVCHLADEEEEDFPVRLELLLHNPAQAWPPIDPEGWATERGYRARSMPAELERYERVRAERLRWLRSMGAVDWGAVKSHSVFGSMRAGDMLAAWAAHDALHLRQLTRRIYQATLRDAGGFTAEYAGRW
ncbi:MAG: DinB family protein [Planctomycetota bacterium]